MHFYTLRDNIGTMSCINNQYADTKYLHHELDVNPRMYFIKQTYAKVRYEYEYTVNEYVRHTAN